MCEYDFFALSYLSMFQCQTVHKDICKFSYHMHVSCI